jgi:hypothetical protein
VALVVAVLALFLAWEPLARQIPAAAGVEGLPLVVLVVPVS